MRVLAKKVDLEPLALERRRFATPGQVFVTAGKEYEVHAITVFEGHVLLQIVTDLDHPGWMPSFLFDIVDAELAADWTANLLDGEPSLVLGPEFVTQNVASYTAMVELEATQVDRFWRRVQLLESERRKQ
jgi:hypothetical protein